MRSQTDVLYYQFFQVILDIPSNQVTPTSMRSILKHDVLLKETFLAPSKVANY